MPLGWSTQKHAKLPEGNRNSTLFQMKDKQTCLSRSFLINLLPPLPSFQFLCSLSLAIMVFSESLTAFLKSSRISSFSSPFKTPAVSLRKSLILSKSPFPHLYVSQRLCKTLWQWATQSPGHQGYPHQTQ